MNEVTAILKQVFTSKKALASIVGLCMIAAKRAGLDISEETLYQVLAVIGTYVVGQGIADNGKEAAKTSLGGPPTEPSGLSPELAGVIEVLQENPRLIGFAAKVLEAKSVQINEAVDEMLQQCTIDLADTVVPPK